MPPLELLLDVFAYGFLAPALAAGAVLWLSLWFCRDRAAPLGLALALLAGLATGNWFRDVFPFVPQHAGWPWLPALTIAAMGAELTVHVRVVPRFMVGLLRVASACLAAYVLVPANLRSQALWGGVLLAAMILCEWLVLGRRAQQSRNGWVPLVAALALAAAAIVLIHAHSARLSDAATMASASFTAIAAIVWLRPVEAGVVAAASSVLLPGLLLSAYAETFSDVPVASFLLVAVSPLTLAASCLLPRKRLHVRVVRLVELVLFLTSLLAAVGLAMRAEPLEW